MRTRGSLLKAPLALLPHPSICSLEILLNSRLDGWRIGSHIDQNNANGRRDGGWIRHAISQPGVVWGEGWSYPSPHITFSCKDIKLRDKGCLWCLEKRLVIKPWGRVQYRFTPRHGCCSASKSLAWRWKTRACLAHEESKRSHIIAGGLTGNCSGQHQCTWPQTKAYLPSDKLLSLGITVCCSSQQKTAFLKHFTPQSIVSAPTDQCLVWRTS